MSKFLVTGAAGFIGSHLCKKLIDAGHEVFGIDNLYLGLEENISEFLTNKHFRWIKTDLLDSEKVISIFKEEKFDRVYHLAANSDIARGLSDRTLDFRLNLETTRVVLEGMLAGNCREIFFASTSAIYGELAKPLDEKSGPMIPVSFYGASKLSAEAFISVYAHQFEWKAWVARFPNVVGGKQTHGVVYDFIKKLKRNPEVLEVLGDGKQEKPYVFVDDLLNGIELMISKQNAAFNLLNIGVTSRTRVDQIAEIVSKALALNPRFQYSGGRIGWKGDVPQFSYQLDLVHSLGWKAQYDSTEAVQKAASLLAKEKRFQ